MKTKTTFTLAVIVFFTFFHCGVTWSQSLSIDEMKRRITPAHEILQEYEKLKFDMTPAGIKAAEEREAEEAKIATERAERQRKEAEATAEAERRRREAEATARANAPVNLKEEMRKSGFSDRHDSATQLNSFAMYGGNAMLQGRWNEAKRNLANADAFDKETAQEKLNAIEEEIRTAQRALIQKAFFGEYTYDPRNVKVVDDQASFTMIISTGFSGRMPNSVNSSFPLPNVEVTESGCRWDAIELSIRGNTDSVQELVRNKNSYRVRIQFSNLQSGISLGALAGNYPGVNVQKIDIIKVQ